MIGIIIVLIYLIITIYLAYQNLNSFKRKITKVLIILLLFILIFVMQIGLVYLGFSNNNSLERSVQGEFVLIILVPIIIAFAEIVLMLLYTYLINKYNKKEISRKKFIIWIFAILFLNSVGILLIY